MFSHIPIDYICNSHTLKNVCMDGGGLTPGLAAGSMVIIFMVIRSLAGEVMNKIMVYPSTHHSKTEIYDQMDGHQYYSVPVCFWKWIDKMQTRVAQDLALTTSDCCTLSRQFQDGLSILRSTGTPVHTISTRKCQEILLNWKLYLHTITTWTYVHAGRML